MKKYLFSIAALLLLFACTPDNADTSAPEAVDMGTIVNGKNVKWASCNLGASKREDCGNYYAWGETEPRTDYSWADYKWCDGTTTSFKKYNTKNSFGAVDNITELQREENSGETMDDAARAKLGGKWRMPTEAEWKALKEQCSWTWTTQNEVKGMLVTASNGNSIFLPAAGKRQGSELSDAGLFGRYWSSSLNAESPSGARCVFFKSGISLIDIDSRCHGLSVRPVTE